MALISIHAPVWGRAKCNRELVSNLLVFQFTPPCGGEPGLAAGTNGLGKPADSVHISIHAPVWGRALAYYGTDISPNQFQFTPPYGGGLGMDVESTSQSTFQFTPPCGGGPQKLPTHLIWQPFQFTPPCGGGPVIISVWNAITISIHAPVWGRGGGDAGGDPRSARHFNSRPRMGAGGHFSGRLCRAAAISIHAPVWGRGVRTAALWPDDG